MFARLLSYARPYRGAFVAAILAMIVRSFVLLASPWPLKFAIDSVILQHALPQWAARFLPDPVSHRYDLLGVVVAGTAILGLADAVFAYFGNRSLLYGAQHTLFALRRDAFAHVQRLALGYHRRQKTGEVLARLGGDIGTLSDFVVGLGTGLFANVLTIGLMLAVMLAIDWRFAVVSALVVPFLGIVAYLYTRRMRAAMRVARQSEGVLWGITQEIVAGIALVQAYGREFYESSRFADVGERNLAATLEASELQAQFSPLVGLVMALGVGITLWVGSMHVIDGTISAGVMLIFLSYLRGIATPLRQMAKFAGSSGKSSVALERLRALLDERPEIADAPGALTPSACVGALELRGVRFGYAGEETLCGIDLALAPGEHVAIAGPTGAGKSTLAALVPRFYDPTDGGVFLDGQDLRSLSLAFLRRHIALVTQEPIVFAGTLWENVAYGRDGASRNDAIAAAHAAGIADVVLALPDGFDTIVGERGGNLSGGQRQCIAIARAMLRDARIVILDEPTANLDPLSERRIVNAINHLTSGRTTITIAHRLSTLANATRIVVLEKGRIVEDGSHSNLLNGGGSYQRMWTEAGLIVPQPSERR